MVFEVALLTVLFIIINAVSKSTNSIKPLSRHATPSLASSLQLKPSA